ncbi:MAG: hypothetical protein HYY34_03675, partial [Chloroflexi bacterium]|nr:hypothetical protein [Chloroflexota bacterium]
MVTATKATASRRLALVFLAFSVVAIGSLGHHARAASQDASPRDMSASSQANGAAVVNAGIYIL